MIHECFSRSELERLAGKAGLEYPGYRLSAVDSLELAFALAEGVADGEAGSEVVRKGLLRVLEPILEAVRRHDPKELKRMVDGPWAFGAEYRPGALALVLAMDARKEVRKLSQRVLRKASPPCPTPEAPARAPLAAKAWAGSLARRAEILETRVEELKRELAEQGVKLSAARAELEPLREKLARAEVQAERVEEESRLRRAAERESQSLRHEIAELRRELESLRSLGGERDAVRRTLQEREAEIARLRSELESLSRRPGVRNVPDTAKDTARPASPSRDASRAGLVVDAQSLYFAARQRGARLEYSRLRGGIPEGLGLGRAIVCYGEVPGVDTRPFRERLSALGYEVHPVPAPPREQGRHQPDERALRILAGCVRDAANRYGTVVVATQYAGLAGAMAEARAAGARVRLLALVEDLAPELRAAADEVVPLAPDFITPLRTGRPVLPRTAAPGPAGGAP